VLRAVGHALATQVRQGVDCAARYGGDEFAVILPSTGSPPGDGAIDGAVALAVRVRQALAAVPAPTGAGDWPGVPVSIGVAAFPEHATDPEGLVSAADTALYLAKRSGKGRVIVSE
jgi:diguanylate cyclase (GGDEF)-like protein